MTAGQLIFRQQTPYNGVLTVRQHGEFRVGYNFRSCAADCMPRYQIWALLHLDRESKRGL